MIAGSLNRRNQRNDADVHSAGVDVVNREYVHLRMHVRIHVDQEILPCLEGFPRCGKLLRCVFREQIRTQQRLKMVSRT